jgi:hypothetical protein
VFFEYTKKIHSWCYEAKDEDCSMNTHKYLDISYDKTKACVTGSFKDGDVNKANDILKKQVE